MIIDLPLANFQNKLQLKKQNDQRLIYDPARKKWVAFQPEEVVRQLFIQFCIETQYCSLAHMSVEKEFEINGLKRRYDLVLYDHSTQPRMLVECKSSSVIIDQSVLDQAARYNMALRVPYIVVTNGWATICCALDLEEGKFSFLEHLPSLSGH